MHPELRERIASRERVLGALRRVLVARLKLRREVDELDADAPLFGSGYGLDSLDAVEIVVALESEFGVKVGDGSQTRASMRTLNTLCDLVVAHEGRS